MAAPVKQESPGFSRGGVSNRLLEEEAGISPIEGIRRPPDHLVSLELVLGFTVSASRTFLPNPRSRRQLEPSSSKADILVWAASSMV